MRTDIDIDAKLLADALNATGASTKREVVELGLSSLIRLSTQQRIKKLRGKLRWDENLDEIRPK